MNVLPGIEKLSAKRILSIYGQAETESLCPQLSGDRCRVVAFKGSHHFGGGYEAIAHTILVELGKQLCAESIGVHATLINCRTVYW